MALKSAEKKNHSTMLRQNNGSSANQFNAIASATALVRELLEEPAHADLVSRMKRSIDGDLYVVGGFLFRHISRNLNRHLVPITSKASDIDFCTSGTVKPEVLKSLFESVKPHPKFDGISIMENGQVIDIFELRKCIWINDGKERTIFTYLEDVTFNIQAIAYDLHRGQLLDRGALSAILKRQVGVQNPVRFDSDRAHWTMKGSKKAETLGFRFVDERARGDLNPRHTD